MSDTVTKIFIMAIVIFSVLMAELLLKLLISFDIDDDDLRTKFYLMKWFYILASGGLTLFASELWL